MITHAVSEADCFAQLRPAPSFGQWYIDALRTFSVSESCHSLCNTHDTDISLTVQLFV